MILIGSYSLRITKLNDKESNAHQPEKCPQKRQAADDWNTLCLIAMVIQQ